MKRRSILVSIAAIAATLWGVAACNSNALIYPGSTMPLPDADYGYPQQHITTCAADGTALRGWFFNRGATAPLVVMYGGNAMNAGAFADIAAADASRSYLLMNYRGYGTSEGEPSEEDIVADARHCIAQARTLSGAYNTPLYLVGFSLGSGVATQVAAAENPAHLVLICPFDSITVVACNMVPLLPRLLPIDTWNSAEFAPRITCPVTILRAEFDTIVPPDSTDRLIRAFTVPPHAVRSYPAGHNTIFSNPSFTADLMNALR